MTSTNQDNGSAGKPPQFKADNFAGWKVRILLFLEAIDINIVKTIIPEGPYVPMSAATDDVAQQVEKAPAQWTDEEKRLVGLDAKARNVLALALPDDISIPLAILVMLNSSGTLCA